MAKKRKLSKKDKDRLYFAAERIERNKNEFSCNAICSTLNSNTWRLLRIDYANFMQFSEHKAADFDPSELSPRSRERAKTARILALLFFAYIGTTEGVN